MAFPSRALRGPWRRTGGGASPAWAPRELPQAGLCGKCLWGPLPFPLPHCHPRAHMFCHHHPHCLSPSPAVLVRRSPTFSSSLIGKYLFGYTSGSWGPC